MGKAFKVVLFGDKDHRGYVSKMFTDNDILVQLTGFQPPKSAKGWDAYKNDAQNFIEDEAMESADAVVWVISPMDCSYHTQFQIGRTITNPELASKIMLCVMDSDERKAGKKTKKYEFKDLELAILDTILVQCEGYGAKVVEELDDVCDELLKAITAQNEADKPRPYVFNPNMIQCTIERDGPTQICLDRKPYMFEKNKRGDYVCMVPDSAVISHLLKTPESFRRYCPDDAIITPEQKRQYGIMLTDDEADSFWNGFIKRFEGLGEKEFCGYTDVQKFEPGPGQEGKRRRQPDKMVFINGFVQKNMELVRTSPDYVRKKLIDKWNEGCAKLGTARTFPV